MTDSPLTLGIIGAGIMGERMLAAASGHPDSPVRIAAIWDPTPAALTRIADAFPDVPQVADAAAVVAASACVYVASPPASHLGHARAALAAGRSVFCEKPLAIDIGDARAFVRRRPVLSVPSIFPSPLRRAWRCLNAGSRTASWGHRGS